MKKNNATVSVKVVALIAAIVLVIGCTVGGAVAWLVSKPAAITNVFTVGNINAELTETTTDYKIVPGVDIDKDPVAIVKANSEDCYLFVQLTEENWPAFTDTDGSRKVEYEIADGWTKVEDGVYYREVPNDTVDQSFPVLKDNKVTVSETLTKEDANAITAQPKLTVTVYAVQKAGIQNPAGPNYEKAWEIAQQ